MGRTVKTVGGKRYVYYTCEIDGRRRSKCCGPEGKDAIKRAIKLEILDLRRRMAGLDSLIISLEQ